MYYMRTWVWEKLGKVLVSLLVNLIFYWWVLANLLIPRYKFAFLVIIIWSLLYYYTLCKTIILSLTVWSLCSVKYLILLSLRNYESSSSFDCVKQRMSKLVAKYKIKWYCSYYNLCLEFLFINIILVSWCFESFFPWR